MLTGNKAKLQVAKETTFGTKPISMTNQLQFFSENFKEKREKKSEGVITGAKGETASYTTKIVVDGGFSCLVRPDDAGLLFAAALGTEGEVTDVGTNGKKHTFTALDMIESASLPSLSVIVDRIANTFTYTGCKINELKLSSTAGDFVKVDVGMIGKSEALGDTLTTLTPSVRRAFKFFGGSLKIGGNTVADLTKIDFSYNNNLQADIQTNSSGLYVVEPQPAQRQISIDVDALFSDNTITQYVNNFKADTQFSLEINFTSDEEIETGLNYSLKITIPAAQIVDSDFGISGTDTLKHNFKFKAIDSIASELITIELVNTNASKYI